jgi:Regulator of ribonuclease activity B
VDSRTIALILVAVAAFSLFRIFSQWRGVSRKRRTVDWDEQFILQLRKAGLSAFDEHTVDFFFTLPTRAACEQIAFQLRPDGYSLDIKDGAEGGGCSLHAQRRMRLVVTEMQELTARFSQLAAQHGGKYDNWAVARQ